MLRRYFGGYTLLGYFLLEAAEASGLQGEALKRLLGMQAAMFDRLISAVTKEYTSESGIEAVNAERRRVVQIQRLLAGELLDASQLGYEVDGHHLGLVLCGTGARAAVAELAIEVDRRPLAVTPQEEVVWAWLGGRRPIEGAEVERCIAALRARGLRFSLGEPDRGLSGWRLTHLQAAAAFALAVRGATGVARYADVALLAAAMQDGVLFTSLRRLYLAPLTSRRDGGEMLRRTLRAYFDAGRNAASAAASLEVSRQTVLNRLRTIEERIGRRLDSCAAELETALALEEIGFWEPPHSLVS